MIARWSCAAVSVATATVVLLAMALRVGFPLELEWMEGGVLHQAHRLLHGQPIYPPPGRDFVPFLYTPGFSVLLAGLGAVAGLDYPLGRLISITSSGAIGLAAWHAVGMAGKPRSHRAAAVGLFASGYVFTFRWLDLARPDALCMALTLWGVVLLRGCRGSHGRTVAGALLLALAFWTKQTAAAFVVASGLGVAAVAPRQLLTYGLTIAVVDGGGVLGGHAWTDGWLWHYVYELHQSHAFNEERFQRKTWGMFAHAGPFVALAGALGVAGWVRAVVRARSWSQRRTAGGDAPYWLLMAATGLVVSALGYSTQWAEPNAFIPAVVMGSVFVAVAMPVGGPLEGIALALAGLQMVFSVAVEPMYQPIQDSGWSALGQSYAWQDPRRTVPSAAARRAAAALRAQLAAAPGPVLALQRPWWAILAGGEGHVGSMGLNDVGAAHRAEIQRTLRAELVAQRFAQVWLEGEPPRWMHRALGGYQLRSRRRGPRRVRPWSGYMSDAGMVTPYREDQLVLVPRATRTLPPGAWVLADFESGRAGGFAVRGTAFGHRAVPGLHPGFRAVGPQGGRFLYSSGGVRGDLAATGSARSRPFRLPQRGAVRLLLGASGRPAKVRAELVWTPDTPRASERAELPVPSTPLQLQPVSWKVPPAWAGREVELVLTDSDPRHALFVDDVWVVPG